MGDPSRIEVSKTLPGRVAESMRDGLPKELGMAMGPQFMD